MIEPVIREMNPGDYERVMKLWESSPGIGLSGADTKEGIARYLERNPGMSQVAGRGDEIVGAVLCGSDGRRGYIHHLAVQENCRRKGLAGKLVRRCLEKLREAEIEKCHLFVVVDNEEGQVFWRKIGWTVREDICVVSMDVVIEERQ